MKSMILYDSVFGNTEHLARCMGDTLAALGECRVIRVQDFTRGMLQGTELILLGSPTRAFKPTPAMMNLLRSLPPGALETVDVGVFDTRIAQDDIPVKFVRFLQKKSGAAAGVMAKYLVRRRVPLLAEPEGFYVLKSEGPLGEGELERAAAWARDLALKQKEVMDEKGN